MKINESGRSMIEMLGVLAIIGVLSVGGIAGYSKAMSKYRVNKTVDQVSHIAANTRILFSAQKDYADLAGANKDTIITKTRLFPDELKYDSTAHKGTNAFAGDVTIAPASRFDNKGTGTGNDGKAFVITYTNIPEEACVDLLTIDWGTGTAGGIISLGTKDGVSTQFTTCATATGVACGAMSVDDAVSACDKVNDNTLIFKFY